MVKNRVGPSKGPQRSRDPFFTNKKSSNQSSNSESTPFFIQSSKSTGESSGNSGNDGFFVKSKSANNSFKSKHDRESNKSAFKSNKTQFSNKNSFEPRKQKYKFDRNDEHKSNKKNNQEKNTNENGGFFNKIKSKPDRDENEVGTKFKGGKIEKRNADKTGKKPFDKKKWRLQKYSKKYKLEQWEDKRKKAVLREYYKEIKDDKPKMDVQKVYSQYADYSDNEKEDKPTAETQRHKYVRPPNYVPHDSDLEDIEFTEEVEEQTPDKPNKNKGKHNAFKKAKFEFERLKQEKIAKREEYLKKKAEKEEAMKEYKKKKNEKFKKLNKKTKRGQPIMKERLEMLLEKIQSA